MSSPALPLRAAIITPSFRGDLEQCRLLVDSAERHVPAHVSHHIVVDQRDLPLFRGLRSGRTDVVCVEDVVKPGVWRIPFVQRVWLTSRLQPVRNWILQQIVKLSMAESLDTDMLVYADSDVFFIDHYDPTELARAGEIPLFREYGPQVQSDFNDQWHGVAAGLLGLPPQPRYLTSYVGNLITWRAKHLRGLRERVEAVTGQSFVAALSRASTLSEYVLYGMYCEHILADAGEQYFEPTINTLCHWHDSALDREGLAALRGSLLPQHVAVMISAKSRTPTALIRKTFAL